MMQGEGDRENLNIKISKQRDIAWLRWILLILVGPLYFFAFKRAINLQLAVILAIVVFYNIINHFILLAKCYLDSWFNLNIYIDIIIVTVLIFFDKPLSYIYLVYFVIIIYESIIIKYEHPIFLSLFVLAIYTIALFFSNINELKTYQFAFRGIFLILSGIFVTQILNEIQYNIKQNLKNYDLSVKDKLTGLYNKNEFDKNLNEFLYECINNNSSLCILLFDIDNFELFNDTYGRFKGDDLLVFFAKILKETISKNDKAYRYGGEEFIVILKGIQFEDAYKIAETIRKKISISNIFVNDKGTKKKISVSCGIAGCPEHSVGFFELIDYADKALKEAKNDGKNKVVIAEK